MYLIHGSLGILGHGTDKETYIFFILLALLHNHHLNYLQLCPSAPAEDLASPLQTLLGFFDHIIHDLLGGFDVLKISPHFKSWNHPVGKEGRTLIMAETSPMSHILPSMDFSGCFSSSSLWGIFPSEVSFLLPCQPFYNRSRQKQAGLEDLHFLLPTPPGLDVICLPDSERSTGVNKGSVRITMSSSNDPTCQHCTSRSSVNWTYSSLCFFGAEASVAATNRVPTQTA